MKLRETLGRYRKQFDNWISVAIRATFGRYPINCVYRKGETKKIAYTRLHLYWLSLGYEWVDFLPEMGMFKARFRGRDILFAGGFTGDLAGVFGDEEYASMDVRGRIVVDVGANVGDSSIYFCLQGARKVIAVEPLAFNCELIQQNARLNGFDERIAIIRAALSYGKATLYVNENHPEKSVGQSAFQEQTTFTRAVPVPSIALSSLVEYVAGADGVLKIDCEGCEYDALSVPDLTVLRNFREIMIEYHDGIRQLPSILSEIGFNVTVTPRMVTRRGKLVPKPEIGLIHARLGVVRASPTAAS